MLPTPLFPKVSPLPSEKRPIQRSILLSDRQRIQKNLFTSHPKSTPVTLKVFGTPVIEASFISAEIKRLIAYSGGLLRYDDFAILCEFYTPLNI